jgi:hypothetical protein
VGDVDAAPVRAGGWEIRGRLAVSPFGRPAGRREDAAGYLDAGELLADGRVDCAVVDGTDPELAALLPRLRRAGLLVLLPTPAPLDVAVLHEAGTSDRPEVGVGLVRRWEPWLRTVTAALPLAGGPVLQASVAGWPTGAAEAAELADLVRGWCGEVVAVVAAPAALPAERLARGEPVDWALLCGDGGTVLVSHHGQGPDLRLSFAGARLLARGDGVRWEGGEQLPLLALPAWVPPAPRGVPVGLVATAAALSEALGGGDFQAPFWRDDQLSRPAGLSDLLVAARVVEALEASARTGSPVAIA